MTSISGVGRWCRQAAPLVLMAGLAATSARAEEKLVTASDYDAILTALEDNDFEGELLKDSDGDPLIKSTDKDEPFSIHFYGCKEHKNCKFIQFTAGWDLKDGITLQKLADWNSSKVWGQAYRDENKDPWIGLAVNFVGGLPMENLDDMVGWWRSILRSYEKHIGWTKE